ncbi:MAG: hypothetical protein HND44_20055 [Chloroflexi bacterium]|nr:hypothetical protein [Ardenticatenaceae bacterium]MBL1130744.1 hypothetical protein [Chloroflexota bacterium]NOG36839.1 hypothetical protein [Chloroflexota bacterium]
MKDKQIWMKLMQSLLIGAVVIGTLLIFSKAHATHSYVKVNTIPQYGFVNIGGVTRLLHLKNRYAKQQKQPTFV